MFTYTIALDNTQNLFPEFVKLCIFRQWWRLIAVWIFLGVYCLQISHCSWVGDSKILNICFVHLPLAGANESVSPYRRLRCTFELGSPSSIKFNCRKCLYRSTGKPFCSLSWASICAKSRSDGPRLAMRICVLELSSAFTFFKSPSWKSGQLWPL